MDQIAEWMRKQYRLRFEKTTHMVQLNKNVRGNRKIAVWLHDLERVIQELETDHGVHTNMDDFMPAHISTCAEKDKYLKRILDNINQNLFFLEIGHMSKTATSRKSERSAKSCYKITPLRSGRRRTPTFSRWTATTTKRRRVTRGSSSVLTAAPLTTPSSRATSR